MEKRGNKAGGEEICGFACVRPTTSTRLSGERINDDIVTRTSSIPGVVQRK
jgi:hypothetical protein